MFKDNVLTNLFVSIILYLPDQSFLLEIVSLVFTVVTNVLLFY